MMKFILTLIFLMLIFYKLEKMILQLFYQNLIFFLMFMVMILIPLNNLNIWLKLYNFMGSDFYSMSLIMLSLWIFSLMIMFSENNLIKLGYLMFIYVMNFMLIFLLLSFMIMNLMMFYVFFESSLIPIFLLIMGWGMQVDRLQAGYYMMIYTLMGSLPLFIMIIVIYSIENSLMLNMIEINIINIYLYMMMMMAFLIKMPMYLFHLWLPKAHVEAPLVGSMILAGVMLKLGSYGLIRLVFIMMNMLINYNKFIMVISLMGGIYSSLICLCQIDMKLLVAYSSVVHMSVLMAGIMTLNNMGLLGGMMMMVAHGLCSSGLFCLVNINYERILSRSLLLNKGLINLYPSLSMMWFFLCSSNLSFPPSLNLFSEIMLFNSLVNWNINLIYLFMILLFFSASYTLYLYSYSQHGYLNYFNYFMKMIMINEYLILMLHWIPLNLLFIFMFIFI